MPKNNEKGALRNWGRFSTIAIQMGATIYLGNLLGQWLDKKLETTFVESVITLFAVFLSMYFVIKAVMRFSK